MADLDGLEWVPSRNKTDMQKAYEEVLEGMSSSSNVVLEQFIARFQIIPEDFDEHSDEVIESYIEKYMKEDEDWRDPSNLGSIYILGVLVGFLMRRDRDKDA